MVRGYRRQGLRLLCSDTWSTVFADMADTFRILGATCRAAQYLFGVSAIIAGGVEDHSQASSSTLPQNLSHRRESETGADALDDLADDIVPLHKAHAAAAVVGIVAVVAHREIALGRYDEDLGVVE